MIENCQCRGQESVSDAISAIEVPTLDSVRIMLTIFYHTNHYAVTGDVVKFSYAITIYLFNALLLVNSTTIVW